MTTFRNKRVSLLWMLGLAIAWVGPRGVAGEFETVALPFMQAYCHECHGGKSVKAELDLKAIQDDATILQDFQLWRGVLQQVSSGEMPPRKAPAKPTAEEITAFQQAIHASMSAAEAKLPPDPGRVTMRRLNRTEYRNTVRDLLMVDYDPTDVFPSDDIGHGFDNIGDVLTLPPLLLERYLDAAEGLAQRAIHLKMPQPPSRTTASIFLEPKGYGSENSTRPVTNSTPELFVRHTIQETGNYIFRVRAASTNLADVDPAKMVLWVNDRAVKEVIVANSTKDWQNYDVRLKLAAGNYRFRAEFANPQTRQQRVERGPEEAAESEGEAVEKEVADGDAVVSEDAKPVEKGASDEEDSWVTVPERMLFVREFKVIGPSDTRTDFMKRFGKVLGEPEMDLSIETAGDRIVVVEETDVAADEALNGVEGEVKKALEAKRNSQVVTWFLKQAFRRPATNSEVMRYLQVLEQGQANADGLFEAGLQDFVMAVLCSPKFLFRVELEQKSASAEPELLNEYQLASRLSYFLWNTMPDDVLFELADKGELTANLEGQVERMLKDPRSEALVQSFGMQWLQLQRLSTFQPDPTLFPAFDENLRQAMFRETELFLGEIMQENKSILDLVTGDYTYLNRRLARHYGVADTALSGDDNNRQGRRVRSPRDGDTEFVRVQFEDGQRGGLLMHGSVLTVTSNPTRTSPVKRGKWVLEQLLGTPPPPPPAGVEELDDQKELTGTLRERMEQHRANVACANCHQTMDALGFAFENFDPIGRFRSKDGEEAIDPSGILPDGQSFSGPVELREVLKGKSELLSRNITEKLLTYALGRGLEYYDERAVKGVMNRLAEEEYRFFSLVKGIVLSDPFRMRRGSDQTASLELLPDISEDDVIESDTSS